MSKHYVPKRGHLIWLDFEPVKGKEIGKYRPALVLSSEEYNQKSGLLICCPISTSARGALTEVIIDNIEKETSVVVSNIIQTLSWKKRKVQFIVEAKPGILEEVLLRIIPVIGAEKFISEKNE